jgi:hypothetical protein
MPTQTLPPLFLSYIKTNLTPSAVGYIRALPSAISSPHPPWLADRASVSPPAIASAFFFLFFFSFQFV